ncbi:Kinesin heavy chain [Cymbomonas tetramitiformis]|uniref:Kinesin-like protein n=1 Tax=Cymbomonas tetramitiformis TaxID=36881 RepID=A0AAE0F266_9CHLO|nr:Kinesin heavy chain [Cymbomonas tetramitiformis]
MGKSAVKVYIRSRPTSLATESLRIAPDRRTVLVDLKKKEEAGPVNNQQENLTFKFESILQTTSQEGVFTQCAQEVCDNVLTGYNGTVFTYGQTGAGKTYTIAGDTNRYEQRGIIPRAIHYLFHEIDLREDREVQVRCSYLEIYNEIMYDLLVENPGTADNLVVVDEGGTVKVKGIVKAPVANEEETLALFFQGENGRSTAQHALNKSSSRSHCIFTIYLETRAGADEKVVSSKLNLVDLAGSERTKKTQVTGQTLKEAMFINKSLTFLEQTVNALSKKESHVPFRQTKLTSVLRDALGGNCKTVMIGCIWGEQSHMEETVSTLRFASRVKTLMTDAVINERNDPTLLLRKYERQIYELKQELAMRDTLSGRGRISYNDVGDLERHELHETVRKYLKGEIQLDDIAIENLKMIKETFKQFRIVYEALDAELIEQRMKGNLPRGEDAGGMQDEVDKAEAGEYEPVGDEDKEASAGFHIGEAPPNARPVEDEATEGTSLPGIFKDSSYPETPPLIGGPISDKNMAYDGYKRDVPEGQEQASKLKQLTSDLKEQKRVLRQHGIEVNKAKQEIDLCTSQLKSFRSEQGETSGENPEEQHLLQQLKAAKSAYRQAFTNLKTQRTTVEPLVQQVAETRAALVENFNVWFAGQAGETTVEDEVLELPPIEKEPDTGGEDMAEQFDRMEMERVLGEDPESGAFHNARKTLRRKKPVPAASYYGDKGRAEGVRRLEQRAARIG